jgi:hypothetical protein
VARRFRHANTQHTCARYTLDSHFAGKSPETRDLFNCLLRALEPFGPVAVQPRKSRIVLQSETPFAAIIVRKHWLEGYLWLKGRAPHRLIRRVEMQVYRDYGHVFRLTAPADLDEAFLALLQEGYILNSERFR